VTKSKKKLATVFLILSLVCIPLEVTQGVGAILEDGSSVNIKKTELMRITYNPENQITSQTAEVSLDVTNNGTSRATFDLVDRAEKVNASTLITLQGTPNPDFVGDLGYITLVRWNNVSAEAGSTLKFDYYVRTWKNPPIDVRQTWYLNNAIANFTNTRGIYFVSANVSDVITFSLSIQNALKPLFWDENDDLVFQPVPYLFLVSFSSTLFSDIRTEPPANSSSLFAGDWYFNWFGFLSDDKVTTLKISARIASTDSWGQVQVNPITVQTSSDVSSFTGQLNSTITELNSSRNASDSLSQSFRGVGDAVAAQGKVTNATAEGLSKLADAVVAQGEVTNATAEGLSKLADAVVAQGEVTNATAEGLSKLADAVAAEAEAINMTADGLNQLADAVVQAKYAIGDMKIAVQNASQALNLTAQAIQYQYYLATYAKNSLQLAITTLQDFTRNPETIAFLISHPRLAVEFYRAIGNMTVAYDALVIMVDGYGELPSLYQLYLYVEEAADGMGSQAESLETLMNAMGQMAEGMYSMAEGLATLSNSTVQIAEGMHSMAEGLATLSNSTVQIAEGMHSMAEGLATLSNSTVQIAEGMHSMAEGLGVLSNSTGQVNESLTSAATVLQNVTEVSIKTADLAYGSSDGFSSQSESIKQEISSINGLLFAAKHYSRPLLGMPDARGIDQPPKFSVKVHVEKLNESFLIIPSVNLDHQPDGYDKVIVYKLFLTLNVNPSSVFVEAYGRTFENPATLGLEYDQETKVLALTPYLYVNDTANILVDWLGNPVRILLKANEEINVTAEVDVAPVSRNVSIDTYSRCMNTINQPIVVTQRIEWQSPPPPPPPEKSWLDALLEILQRVEVQVLICALATLIGIVIGMIYLKRKGGKGSRVDALVPPSRSDPKELYDQIELLEEKLREKSNRHGETSETQH
jgi:ABC-type transporter Mla subunit MlaD